MVERKRITFVLRMHGWLRLLRIPNLSTVPGDPLAGVAAAVLLGAEFPEWRKIAFCVLAALFLYCAGLILNDLCDFNHDWVCRPRRPLPSGQVSLLEAALGLILFAAAGLFLAAKAGATSFLVAMVLLSFIGIYCTLAKEYPRLGAVVMGLCRGSSVMLCVPQSEFLKGPLFLAVAVTLYVAVITIISRGEDKRVRHGTTAWIPLFAVLFGFGGVAAFFLRHALSAGPFFPWMLGVPAGVGLAAAVAVRTARGLNQHEKSRHATQKGIMRLIGALPLLQFAIMALVPPLQWAGVALVGMTWAVGALFGRRYPGT